jgi:proteasome-associated ATPase
VILAVLPEKDAEQMQKDHIVNVPWNAVGGLSEAKTAMEEAVMHPFEHPALFHAYGQQAPRGVLLYGPPGNGKTLLAKAVATRLGGDKGIFLSINGPEVLDPFVGITERRIRDLFTAARDYRLKHQIPVVLFIDEAEALLSRRGNGHGAMVQRTVVPTFLTEMDGLAEQAAFVILATNRPELLDEAVVRDGRIDRKIEITRPSAEDARQVLAIHIGETPLHKHSKKGELIDYVISEIYLKHRESHNIPLMHFVSAAMLAGVVRDAKANAIRRDLGGKSDAASGLMASDFAAAIDLIQAENTEMQHAA